MRTIWHDLGVSLEFLEDFSKNTLIDHLGIEFTEVAKDHIRATMPVDHRTVQPMGLLHGGASAVLAETLGSVASGLVIDKKTHFCVGASLNISHLKGVRQGLVHAVAYPLHLGKTSHVWDIKIRDEDERLIAVSRLTVAVREIRNNEKTEEKERKKEKKR